LKKSEERKSEVKKLRKILVAIVLAGYALAAAGQGSGTGSGEGYGQGSGEGRIHREGNSWVAEISGTLPVARNIRVETQTGSVRVQGGGPNEIRYVIRKRAYYSSEDEARRELENLVITAKNVGDTAVFVGQWSEGRNHRGDAQFSITAPRDIDSVRIQTSGGSVAVVNIAGRVEAGTAGGSVSLDQIGGNAAAHTAGGSVSVGTIGGDAVLKTSGGSISVQNAGSKLIATTAGGSINVGNVQGAASVRTAGGSINVSKTGASLLAETAGGTVYAGDIGGPAVLRTSGGNIKLGSAQGDVTAETSGGSIQLMKVRGGARAETSGGSITVEFAGDHVSNSNLEGTGDITVYLPSNLACSIRAAIELGTRGRNIRSDFTEINVRSEGSEYGPKQWIATGNLNGGGPTIRISTNTGAIDIRKSGSK
jgi:DUF4097 and DUF4098 domain-containing protein YvlB